MEPKPLPNSKQQAFLESALYEVFTTETWPLEDVTGFLYGGGTLDAWCPRCGRPSVFEVQNQSTVYDGSGYSDRRARALPESGLITITAFCARKEAPSESPCRSPLYVMFAKVGEILRKVGQSPSIADLALSNLDEALRKELDSEGRHELRVALGLYAHGVGIGSFVYLRRIFETLIEEAHGAASGCEGWDEDEYRKARVPERIKLLREQLPTRLVEAANLYKVLSGGVHELSEEECLRAFPVVRAAIELILKERHEEKRYDLVVREVNDLASDS